MRMKLKLELLCFSVVLSVSALAQNSNVANVNLLATLPESVTVSVDSTSLTILSLTPGEVNAFPGTVNVTTAWVLKPGRNAVGLYAYFDSASAAMAHQDSANTADIPAGAILAKLGSTGSYTALSNTMPSGFGASGLQLFNQTIGTSTRNASRTDAVQLELDLSATVGAQNMKQLPADLYQGTLHIQAQATL
jgi:hypothetical protein